MKSKYIVGLFLAALLSIFPLACSDRYENTAERQEPGSVDNAVSDASLTTSVKMRLADDELVKARNIDVDTKEGLVSLHGDVGSEAEAERAIQIAKNVEGVRSVRSFLKVDSAAATGTDDTDIDHLGDKAEKAADDLGDKTEKAVDDIGDKTKDAAITTSVKMKFAADDTVEALDIDVDTSNGVVTLNGTVHSKAEEKRAIQIAKSVENVLDVKSNLTIQQ